MKKFFPFLIVTLALVSFYPINSYAATYTIKVTSADSTLNLNLPTAQSDLINKSNIQPMIIVGQADTILSINNTPPPQDMQNSAVVTPIITVSNADSILNIGGKTPENELTNYTNISPAITVSFADTIFNTVLSKPEEIIAVTGIKLNKSKITLQVGNTDTLVATVLPSDASNKSVLWSSTNASVATIDSKGVVKGIKPGTAIISAKSSNSAFQSACEITVITPTIGDVNGNGQIDINDAIAILAHVTGTTKLTDSIKLKNADVNGDKKITDTDALLVLQYVTGIIKKFPI